MDDGFDPLLQRTSTLYDIPTTFNKQTKRNLKPEERQKELLGNLQVVEHVLSLFQVTLDFHHCTATLLRLMEIAGNFMTVDVSSYTKR